VSNSNFVFKLVSTSCVTCILEKIIWISTATQQTDWNDAQVWIEKLTVDVTNGLEAYILGILTFCTIYHRQAAQQGEVSCKYWTRQIHDDSKNSRLRNNIYDLTLYNCIISTQRNLYYQNFRKHTLQFCAHRHPLPNIVSNSLSILNHI